jgi:prolyl-tRNA editing enzyme YbaK/EbsC (Cys-tRNA(Pro) deacylase)
LPILPVASVAQPARYDAAMVGKLDWTVAKDRPELLAAPVLAALPAEAQVAEIDPDLADTAAFCERYDVPLDVSANCVIVAGKRGDQVRYAACLVLATQRADVNGVVRRRLDARKVSFAPMAEATAVSAMEYGGITPIGLPADWPILVDEAVALQPEVVIGSGLRRSKLQVPGPLIAGRPNTEVIALAKP